METAGSRPKVLFILNGGAGTQKYNLPQAVEDYYRDKPCDCDVFTLKEKTTPDDIRAEIARTQPERVVAAGGDGTVKLVAAAVADTPLPIAILPCGSANGLAKELLVPQELEAAMQNVLDGEEMQVHATTVNGELCIHLADIGFNAYVVKLFDEVESRGMLTYAKAAIKALRRHRKFTIKLCIDNKEVVTSAAMVVIANATQYGTGVTINPIGKLTDEVFEVVVLKEYSLLEVLKMKFLKSGFNPKAVRFYPTGEATITARKGVHFQVDGEYQGKVKEITARIKPRALTFIVPPQRKEGEA